jgi:hypothetical protein
MLKYRSRMAIVTYGSATIILLVIGYLAGSLGTLPAQGCPLQSCNRTLTATYPASMAKQQQLSGTNTHAHANDNVEKAEKVFETTMRSCLGTFCFDDAVRATGGKDVVRVGILTPDIADGERILSLLVAGGIPVGDKIELIATTNVPPYGYGKNHGWSRIIRIARPLIPQSIGLLSSTSSEPNRLETADILIDPQVCVHLASGPLHFIMLYNNCWVQVRQLMRWHCRLSHVAAHTAMLTGTCHYSSVLYVLREGVNICGQNLSC